MMMYVVTKASHMRLATEFTSNQRNGTPKVNKSKLGTTENNRPQLLKFEEKLYN